MIPVALTIAGSDPSGGAGIQADLKTFSALKVYGMAVATALTAQNTRGVSGLMAVPETFLAEQIDSVMTDIVPSAVKTGMLLNAANVRVVAERMKRYAARNLVVDPVMVSSSGRELLDRDGIAALRRDLLPAALVVMPNVDEARVLSGREIRTIDDLEQAARAIHAMGPKFVFAKGGHLEGDAIDVLFDGVTTTRLPSPRLNATDTHGTGCILSAALAAHLARGENVANAALLAKELVTTAIRNGLRLGSGRGPCDPLGLRG